ncbi:MAG: hypothetical protein RLY31_687 [Bacteroidota bacterium]|jgi:polyisoprenoid-binding protein YceI
MKQVQKFSKLWMAIMVFGSLSFTNPPAGGSYQVNAAQSMVQWKGYKVTGEHYGVVSLQSGTLELDDKGMFTAGSFVVDMGSITVQDIQGGGKEKLEGHLKSDDFFGVGNHPTARFQTTRVISRGKPGEYKVIGNMTIKNITKEIKFDAVVQETDGQLTATATLKLDRSDYDVRFGSGSFFDELGDRTIYDEFDLVVQLKAGK